MTDRIRWHNLYVSAYCPGPDGTCRYGERIEDPMPDDQKGLVRRARAHARATGHSVSLERAQVERVVA